MLRHAVRRCALQRWRSSDMLIPTRDFSSARYAAAESALSSLPELQAAKDTPDASAAYDHLKRALEIVSAAGDHKLTVVAHGHLARHCYAVGHAGAERGHRLAAIDALRCDAADDDDAAMVAPAYNALALSCLRVGTSESLLAAGAAAGAAEGAAASAGMRVAASLHSALARPRGSDAQRMLLSGIASVEGGGSVDVGGFAEMFLAVFAEVDGGGVADQRAVKRLRSVLARWEGRGGFDLVELQCLAAREYVRRGPEGGANRENLDAAQEVLSLAVDGAEKLGNRLDMSEPLLALAHVYAAMRRKVEAEGLYRSVEERFSGLKERKAFTVLSAEVYCRALEEFAQFLEVAGRTSDAKQKRKSAAEVAASFPDVLGAKPHVPLWFVDSCIEHYAVPPPVLL